MATKTQIRGCLGMPYMSDPKATPPELPPTAPLLNPAPPSADAVAEAVMKKMEKKDNLTFWFLAVGLAVWWLVKRIF